jgi:hypothetical protein
MPTTTELVKRVMKRIGALDAGENQTAAENADVLAIMESVYSELLEKANIDWTLTAIPARCEDAFISVVAARVAPDFGLDSPDVQLRGVDGMRRLYQLTTRRIDPRESPVVDY